MQNRVVVLTYFYRTLVIQKIIKAGFFEGPYLHQCNRALQQYHVIANRVKTSNFVAIVLASICCLKLATEGGGGNWDTPTIEVDCSRRNYRDYGVSAGD